MERADSTTMGRAQSSTGFAVDLNAAGEAHRNLADENRKLWVESKRVFAAFKATKTEHEAALKEIAQLREEITALKIHNHELREAKVLATKFETQFNAMQDRVAVLEEDKLQLNALSADKSEQIAQLQDEIAALEEERQTLYTQVDEKNKNIEDVSKEVEQLKAQCDAYAKSLKQEEKVQTTWAEILRNTKHLLEQSALLQFAPMSSAQAKDKLDNCAANVKSFQDTTRRDVETSSLSSETPTIFAKKLLAGLAEILLFLGRTIESRNEYVAKVMGVQNTGTSGPGSSSSASQPAAPSAANTGATGLTFWKAKASA